MHASTQTPNHHELYAGPRGRRLRTRTSGGGLCGLANKVTGAVKSNSVKPDGVQRWCTGWRARHPETPSSKGRTQRRWERRGKSCNRSWCRHKAQLKPAHNGSVLYTTSNQASLVCVKHRVRIIEMIQTPAKFLAESRCIEKHILMSVTSSTDLKASWSSPCNIQPSFCGTTAETNDDLKVRPTKRV
jgi:hypothetical protein